MRQSWLYWAIGAVSLIFVGMWLFSWIVQVSHYWATLQQNPTDATKKQFDASLEVIKAIVGGIGTLATISGGVVLYLNFRVANQNAKTAQDSLKLTQAKLEQDAEKVAKDAELAESRLITDRFSKAVEQLGSDKIEVRLGGIYALERIAQDSERDHWTIMEVLTSFIQEKSPVKPSKTKQEETLAGLYLQEQRKTANQLMLPTITKDVQAALTVIGRRNVDKDEGKQLNLTNTNLSGANLASANLSSADLSDANLSSADLNGANLSSANLIKAILVGTNCRKTNFLSANLIDANLARAILSHANLNDTNVHGADLSGASLTSAKLKSAILVFALLRNSLLISADLSNADLQGADFKSASINGANFSNATLQGAKNITDGQLQTAKLCHTTLPDSTQSNRDCEELELPENEN